MHVTITEDCLLYSEGKQGVQYCWHSKFGTGLDLEARLRGLYFLGLGLYIVGMYIVRLGSHMRFFQ